MLQVHQKWADIIISQTTTSTMKMHINSVSLITLSHYRIESSGHNHNYKLIRKIESGNY